MGFLASRRRGWQMAAVVGAALLLSSCSDDDGLGPDIPEPEILSSRNGVLQVTLTQAPAMSRWPGAASARTSSTASTFRRC